MLGRFDECQDNQVVYWFRPLGIGSGHRMMIPYLPVAAYSLRVAYKNLRAAAAAADGSPAAAAAAPVGLFYSRTVSIYRICCDDIARQVRDTHTSSAVLTCRSRNLLGRVTTLRVCRLQTLLHDTLTHIRHILA